jgi:hypothetical protein
LQWLLSIFNAQCGSLFQEAHLYVGAFDVREIGLKQSLVPIDVVPVSWAKCVLNNRHLEPSPCSFTPPFWWFLEVSLEGPLYGDQDWPSELKKRMPEPTTRVCPRASIAVVYSEVESDLFMSRAPNDNY